MACFPKRVCLSSVVQNRRRKGARKLYLFGFNIWSNGHSGPVRSTVGESLRYQISIEVDRIFRWLHTKCESSVESHIIAIQSAPS